MGFHFLHFILEMEEPQIQLARWRPGEGPTEVLLAVPPVAVPLATLYPRGFIQEPLPHLVLSSPSASQCVILKLSSLPSSHQPLLPQEELTTPPPSCHATLSDPLNSSYHIETAPPIYLPV